MSRNFGIPARQRGPELLSPWAKDIIAAVFLVAFIGSVIAMAFVEFPNGLADLRRADLQLFAQRH